MIAIIEEPMRNKVVAQCFLLHEYNPIQVSPRVSICVRQQEFEKDAPLDCFREFANMSLPEFKAWAKLVIATMEGM